MKTQPQSPRATNHPRVSVRIWLSGAICGRMWWPSGQLGAVLLNATARGPFGFYSAGDSFRDALNSLLCAKGGDFSGSQFTADTVLRLEMTVPSGSAYRYAVRVREIPVASLKDCADLVNAEAYTSDFNF